jgi:hypothetical protein
MGCPYAFMFGKPGTGFHSMRFMGYAVGDTVGTILLALMTSWIFKINWMVSLVVWFVAGEVLHYYYGAQTAFLTTLGIEACPKRI